MARAGNRDVAETGVEQVWVHACVSIDQDALRGESLGTVASYRITVIEMAMFAGVEFYPPVVVETGGNLPIMVDGLYDGKVAVGDAQPPVGSRELNTVTHR